MTCGELLQIAAKHWVHKACCLYRGEWVARRHSSGKNTWRMCFCLMPWNRVEDHEKAWMELVATSGQTSFALKRSWQASILAFSPAAQLFGWVGAGIFTCLSIHLHWFSYCAWAAWILLQPFSSSTLGFLLFYQTTIKAPQRVILTNPLPPASALHWSFPRGKPAKTLWLPFTGAPCTSVCSPAAIGTGTARALPSLGFLCGWDSPAFALEGPIFSDWCSAAAN